MATQGRKKQARNVTEAVTKGVKQMDTEDEVESRLEEEIREYRNCLIPTVYELREDVTQSELADIFDVDQGHVSRILS
jgi:predicted house-cleaning noncanonical NTP pyrophosphatase (MazG superfamily)